MNHNCTNRNEHTHRNKPELLAPAGGLAQLKTAIAYGADAVYLAADKFGMRARADNFSLDEACKAIEYAHQRSVSVYITINILMNDSEITHLHDYCKTLANAGADAFIVSDMGALATAKEAAPDCDIHISTQASIMNAAAARMWHSLGATRIVCAREMSLRSIAELRKNIPESLEIEAFVHGAMCMAYSGRCLLSSAMTGRSANKGACAQSCRWNYALVEEKRPGEYFPIEEDASGTYIMNAEDLCMIDHLQELQNAGVSSLKIEGRNKRSFYVASVVGAYRRVLDGGSLERAHDDLCAISHRPYGTGFYFGRPNQTTHADGYIKDALHVADFMECELCSCNNSDGVSDASTCGASSANGFSASDARTSTETYRITVLCRNRFFDGDTLEVIAPGCDSFPIHISNVHLLVPREGKIPFVEQNVTYEQVKQNSYPERLSVANRAGEYYQFTCSKPLPAHSFIRRRIDAPLPAEYADNTSC
jgi:hypothetical protein